MTLENPLLKPSLILIERQEPVSRILENKGMITILGMRIDELSGIQVAAASVLTLVTLGGGMVAIGAFTLHIAVG